MSDTNGASPAVEFRALSAKNVQLPHLKKTVKIRKLTPLDLLKTGQLFTVLAAADADEKRTRAAAIRDATANPADAGLHYQAIITEGVVAPMVRTCEWSEVDWDAGEVHISVFAEDLFWLGNEILEFSGLGGGAASKAEPFPAQSRAGSSPPRDGARVRVEAVGSGE